jgi:hypothetical protein
MRENTRPFCAYGGVRAQLDGACSALACRITSQATPILMV